MERLVSPSDTPTLSYGGIFNTFLKHFLGRYSHRLGLDIIDLGQGSIPRVVLRHWAQESGARVQIPLKPVIRPGNLHPL